MSDSPLGSDVYDFATVAPIPMAFAFRIRIFFKERLQLGATPMGGRVYVPPAGGDISGPKLQGRVVPYSGADYGRGHSDGAGELVAHYMLEAADGTPIYVHNRGFLYGRDPDGRPVQPFGQRPTQTTTTPDGATTWTVPDDTYFVCIPAFDAPVGPHDWLTRHVFVGRGRRVNAPDHTVFDYFVVNPPKNW